MIVVAGENLIDLLVDEDGNVLASPGGGPFNVARTIARLGMASTFLGRLSRDHFGQMLRHRLERDGVTIALPEGLDAPSALAVVDVDSEGTPRYRFHLSGTAAFELDAASAIAVLRSAPAALHVGTLGLAIDPMATSLERLVGELPAETLLLVDPNCRPEAIGDQAAYEARLARIFRRADLVKASVEDLEYLFPGASRSDAASTLLALGPAAVVVTDGPRPVRADLAAGELVVEIPATDVVDTVGAGDAFGGTLLAWWLAHELGRPDLARREPLRAALTTAAAAAAITCERSGADPPAAAELDRRSNWAWTDGNGDPARAAVDGAAP